MRTTVATLALGALAAPALAQSFTADIGFRNDHDNSNVHEGYVLTPGAFPFDPLPVEILFGSFNAQGFTNRGLFNFVATVTVTGGAIQLLPGPPGSGMRAPYNGFPIESLSGGGTVLTFDANRGIGEVTVPWAFGQPAPAETYAYPTFSVSPPNGGAPDEFFPGQRIFVGSYTDYLNVQVTVQGTVQVVTSWFALESVPPTGPGTPGFQRLIPTEFLSATATRTLFFVPAPGAAAVLGLAGLATTRRRRA